MPIPEQENLLAAFGKAETEATFVGEEIVIPIELWDKLEVAINTCCRETINEFARRLWDQEMDSPHPLTVAAVVQN
jgi:hypothetical protein